MAFHVVERADGRRFLGTYETRQEAEEHRARLIEEDEAYEDVLLIRSDDDPYTLCPYCGERVEPDDPGVEYAVEQREVHTFGPTRTIVDGMGGFFHPDCSPEAVGYVRRPRP